MTPHRIDNFGDIGLSVTADGVRSELDALPASAPVLVRINSDGGSVSEAIAIYNLLRTWSGQVDVEIVGWALSAATIIAMAGKTIRAHETSLFMVHAPWVSTSGNADALRAHADTLDQVKQTMRLAYGRTKQPARVIEGWLDGADHWMTAEEALAAGLVDEVIPISAHAAAALDIKACRFTVPGSIQERYAMSTQPATKNEDDIRAAAVLRADQERRGLIRAAFDTHAVRHPSLQAEMRELQRKCEDDLACTDVMAKAKILEIMAAGASSLGSHYTPRESGADRLSNFRAAAADVLLMRAGIKVAEPHPAIRDVQRMSIASMAESVLSMTGRSTRNMSNAEIISAALTTSDFPALLANVSGKSLRAGYESAPATFAGWTGERTVRDFKQQSLVALSEAPALQQVAEGAEYKFGAFADSASPFKVDTYGRIVRITRQALINDDTDAFTRMPQAFGAAARRIEADLVYDRLTSNPVLGDGVALFHATHGNLGAAAAPSIDTLAQARSAMRLQKGLQKLGFLDPQPRYVICPVALESSFEMLLSSLVDPTKNNATPNLEWIRGLTLVADPRLDANSTSIWYLAAAPAQFEGVIRGYLEGQDRPYMEENQAFERDVMELKCRLDVCAGVIDYRALYRRG